MGKLLSLALLILFPLTIHAQDYATCNTYIEIGDYARAKQCLYAFKGTSDPGALCFFKMNLAINEGDGATAKSLFAEAEKLSATDPFVVGAKTIYIVYSNNAEAAKLMFEPVLKTPKNVSPLLLMEVTRAFFKFKSKDLGYALNWINILEKQLKQPNPDWLILKGDYFAAQGDHGTALNFYNNAIDADSKKSISYHRKGLAYRRIKNPSAAMGELDMAIKLNPEFTQALLHKAEVHFEMGEVDLGARAYAEYFNRAPEDMRARIQLSRYLFAAKKFKEAEDAALFVSSKDPDNLAAIKILAYTNFELGKFADGLKQMESFFAKADSANIQSRDYEYLAKYYQKNNSDSLAILALQKALTFEDADGALYTETGNLLMKKNKYIEAKEIYRNKSGRFPLTSADNYNFGRAALMLREYDLADSIFTKVCEIQPNWAPGFLMKAKTSANLDPDSKEGRAFPAYERYIVLAEADSANPDKYKAGLLESYRYMGYYYFLKKDKEMSRSFWKKVLVIDPNDKQAKDVLKEL
ncbi:MAG: tetratricopeptide repeat protein [Bacteroidota bacterium]|jgi:tetratricopeptide (TPR) repeat protein